MNFGTGFAAVYAFATLSLAACQSETNPAQEQTRILPLQNPILVEVKKDGTIWLNGEHVTQDELEKRLESMPVEGTDAQLHPDKEAAYGDIAKAMEALQRTGHAKKTGILGGT